MKGIYLIKNKVNGKMYVGQAQDIEKRWKKHISQSKNPKYPIHKAIKKYGVENFEFSILEDVEDDEMLSAREIYWIGKLDTFNPEKGYNLTVGGEGHNQGKNSKSKEYVKEYSTSYRKEYYKKHREEVLQYQRPYQKQYHQDHKEERKEYQSKYAQDHKIEGPYMFLYKLFYKEDDKEPSLF